MKSSWTLLTINDVCSVTDCQHKTAPTVDIPTEYRMLRTTNIRNGQLRDVNDTKSVAKDIYDKWSVRGYLEFGDVILTREAPMGEVALLRENEKYKYFLGQRMLQLKAYKDVITPEFLYYSLQTRELQHQIMMNEGTGSVVSNIRIPLLKKMKLVVPNLQEQQRITKLLFDIDNKIIVNKEIIDNLERLSQTLFKHWFIDFEFPNEQGQPYKSSGGEMAESELGEIPSMFKCGTIRDFCDLKYGKALTKKNRIPGAYPVYGSGGVTGTHKDYLIEGPGVIVGRKGSIGTLYLEFNNFYPIDTVFYTESKDYPPMFLYLLFKQYDFTKANNDSAVPGLNRDFVYNTKAVVPDLKIVNKFEKIISSIYETIRNLSEENRILEELRDTLLPKLLSGEIKIPDEVVVD
ncbi:restriction endonuclease subunit S [Bacillus paranthracis]|uniref:restriction endonuclease subunit S n=1 Tax=Bacillus paranthracis TaxID=2026186 RepID=UPI001F0D8372|nr:restriction endonuclease subunit S [Bacillus paranthracis]MCH5438635.1 restriction endonuclease subunit S [Bacillus paranthracis]